YEGVSVPGTSRGVGRVAVRADVETHAATGLRRELGDDPALGDGIVHDDGITQAGAARAWTLQRGSQHEIGHLGAGFLVPYAHTCTTAGVGRFDKVIGAHIT